MLKNTTTVLLVWLAVFFSNASSQQVTVGTPFRSSGNRFFEHFGIGFGFEHVSPNSMMFFHSGSGMGTPPFFDGFDPSSASTFGIGGRNGNWNWNLNFTASQGSSSSNVSTMPFLTLPNGGFGFVNDTVQRPFVVGFTPIVNGGPEEYRQAMKRHYEGAAKVVVQQRLWEDQQEAAELEKLRNVSRQNSARRPHKADDPPLILGRSRGLITGAD